MFKPKFTQYRVKWRGCATIQGKKLNNVIICEASKECLAVVFPRAIPIGTPINMDFMVSYNGKEVMINTETEVAGGKPLPKKKGIKLTLKYTAISADHMHALSNALHLVEIN